MRFQAILFVLILVAGCTGPTPAANAKIILNPFPDTVLAGEEFAITWYIDGGINGTIQTSVRYGKESKPYAKTPSDL